ncbi:DUF4349 domain-containing protein [Novosphingobium sp. MW5]|nr:DUF4349 domain-containing protein [Novosphingobium sp. MW5]
MRKNTLMLATALVSTTLLAGCKSEEPPTAEATPEVEAPAQESRADTAPGVTPAITPGVAPGVAFNYTFAFTLPAKSISTVQQKHAEACAALGASKCRVTGVSFEQESEDKAGGRTDFMLAPDLAYRFGNEGIAAVEKASGKLANAQVNGRDAGSEIKLSQADSASLQAEIARIEQRLAAKGLTGDERAELQRQIASLRGEVRTKAQERKGLESEIATTPVSFTYSSQGVLDGGNTFGKAASASWSSASTMLSMVALFAGVLLPWVLLAALIVLLFRSPDLRRVLRRVFGGRTAPAPIE